VILAVPYQTARYLTGSAILIRIKALQAFTSVAGAVCMLLAHMGLKSRGIFLILSGVSKWWSVAECLCYCWLSKKDIHQMRKYHPLGVFRFYLENMKFKFSEMFTVPTDK